MNLDWRDATKADRRAIEAFKCTTDPPKKPGRRPSPHPKPWEYAVQKGIHRLRPPIAGADGRMMLGVAEGGSIGAVSLWTERHDYPGLFKSQIVAVSTEFRGTSADPDTAGLIASEALDVTIQEMANARPGGRVYGLIHRKNAPSQRLVQTHGFRLWSDFPIEDADLQAWAARLPTPGT